MQIIAFIVKAPIFVVSSNVFKFGRDAGKFPPGSLAVLMPYDNDTKQSFEIRIWGKTTASKTL